MAFDLVASICCTATGRSFQPTSACVAPVVAIQHHHWSITTLPSRAPYYSTFFAWLCTLPTLIIAI
jgi:hypothetical protein